jgi:transcription antitermination factor NusG
MSQKLEWYAVRTRSNCETRIRLILAEKGIENYLPTFREVHQWKDRKKVVEQPLFPGYLFARMVDCRESRLSVLRSDGVVSILGHGETIEPVPEKEIEAVRRLLSSNTSCQAHPLLQEGAWVRVKCGPLKNLEGLLVRVKNQSRLVLSITLLSQSVSSEIDANYVQYLRSMSQQVRRIA